MGCFLGVWNIKKTLMRHCRCDVVRPGEVQLDRTRLLLGEVLEKGIVTIVHRTELRRLAFTVAENSGVKKKFNMNTDMAGLDWLLCFLNHLYFANLF